METYIKTYYIIQINLITNERLIFGETKIKYADKGFFEFQLSNQNLNHKYKLLDKKYCKDNDQNPLTVEL